MGFFLNGILYIICPDLHIDKDLISTNKSTFKSAVFPEGSGHIIVCFVYSFPLDSAQIKIFRMAIILGKSESLNDIKGKWNINCQPL